MRMNVKQSRLLQQELSAAVNELRICSRNGTPRSAVGSLEARLAPLDQQGQPEAARSIEVKDFDEQGISFHHESPLHGRRAVLVLNSPQLGRLAAEVDLTWCQFNRTGRYTSGGRFVRPVGNTA